MEGLAIKWGGAKCGGPGYQFHGKQFYEQMGCSSNQWWAGYQMGLSQLWRGRLSNGVVPNMEGLAIKWGGAKSGEASCQFLENKLTNEWGVALNSGGASY